MAILYVRSTDGNNADDGSTWALAKATLAGALAAASAGDTIYVSQAHAESTAAGVTINGGTAASPIRIICVNDGAEPPTALATTATVSATGTNSLVINGFLYCYGIDFRQGSGSGSSGAQLSVGSGNSPTAVYLDTCILTQLSTGNSVMAFGQAGSASTDDTLTHLVGCTLLFGVVGQTIATVGKVVMKNCSFATSATVPTTLFTPAGDGHFNLVVSGGNMAAIDTGNNVFNVGTASRSGHADFHNCKLGSGYSYTTGTPQGPGGVSVRFVNCDSGDTNYKYLWHDAFFGDVYDETTIVRTGGSSDGTTAFSRKVVTSANSNFFSPLVCDPIIVWNETTGSALTATVEIITDNVTLTDAEAWLEVEYLGTSGYPLSLFANDRAADILATPANQTTSTETWTTTGLTTPVKQKLAVSFTPQEKGPIKLRVHVAKASTTVYVCQKATVA